MEKESDKNEKINDVMTILQEKKTKRKGNTSKKKNSEEKDEEKLNFPESEKE